MQLLPFCVGQIRLQDRRDGRKKYEAVTGLHFTGSSVNAEEMTLFEGQKLAPFCYPLGADAVQQKTHMAQEVGAWQPCLKPMLTLCWRV